MSKKISLVSAILININIMLGAGIFINGPVLAKEAGALSPFIYLIVAVLLLPLILGIAQLLSYYQENGTFYNFGTAISPSIGFLSSWSYFIGKLASATLSIHLCNSFLQQTIPILKNISTINLDFVIIFLFTLLNSVNIKTNQAILYYFVVSKLVPIMFGIFSGAYLFNIYNFGSQNLIWSGIPLTIPLVLYVYSGFEASCSLSTQIENPKKNGPRAIFISYGIVVFIVFLYQLFIYGALGVLFSYLNISYLDIFPTCMKEIFGQFLCDKYNKIKVAYNLLHILIATSALGSSYSILYSNSWNLYSLANYGHTFFQKLLVSKNKFGMPYYALISESLIVIAFLLITGGSYLPLQQVSSLGTTIAYSSSALALLVISYKKRVSLTIAILSIFSCSILLLAFTWTTIVKGPSQLLIIYLLIIAFGFFMLYMSGQKKSIQEI